MMPMTRRERWVVAVAALGLCLLVVGQAVGQAPGLRMLGGSGWGGSGSGTANTLVKWSAAQTLADAECSEVAAGRLQCPADYTIESGAAGSLNLRSGTVAGTGWSLNTSNHLLANSAGAYNIGNASGTAAPLDLYLVGPAVTVGSGTGVTVNTRWVARTGYYKVTVSYTNCVAAALTCDLTVATLPAKTFLRRVFADLTTTYACASTCTTATLSGTLGTSAGGTQLLASMDLDAATAQFGDADAELGSAMNAAALTANGALIDGVLQSWSATTTVTYRITSGTGNLGDGSATNLSQGSITFYLVTDVAP